MGWRNVCEAGLFNPNVAVTAVNSKLAYMVLVTELNRLFLVYVYLGDKRGMDIEGRCSH